MMKTITKGSILKRFAAVFAIFALVIMNLTPLLAVNADTQQRATDKTGTWYIGHNSKYAIIYGITEEGLNRLKGEEGGAAVTPEANAPAEAAADAAVSAEGIEAAEDTAEAAADTAVSAEGIEAAEDTAEDAAVPADEAETAADSEVTEEAAADAVSAEGAESAEIAADEPAAAEETQPAGEDSSVITAASAATEAENEPASYTSLRASGELAVKETSTEQNENSVKVVVPSVVTANDGNSYTVGQIGWQAFSADRYEYCSAITDFEFPSTLFNIYQDSLTGTAFFNDPNNWTKDGCLYVGTADNPDEYLVYGTAMNTVNDEATVYGGMTKDKVAEAGIDASNVVVKKGTRLIACQAFVPTSLMTGSKLQEYEQYGAASLYDDLKNQTLKSVSFESGSQLEQILTGAFRYSQSLESVTLPDGMTVVGPYAFDQCEYLRNVYIPESVTLIRTGAFSYCKRLQLVLPNTGALSIEKGAFYNANGQMWFTIPDKMTVLRSGWFHGLRIMNITIPATVTEIQQDAFFSWLPLTDRYSPTINFNTVTYGGSAKQWAAIGGSALTFRKITYGAADVTASGDKYKLRCDSANVTNYGIIVKKGESFSFSVALKKGYSKGDDFSVTANGNKLSGSKVKPSWSSSKVMVYTITNVQEDQTISVKGIVEKESAGKSSSSGSSDAGSDDEYYDEELTEETPAEETVQAAETSEPQEEISAQETETGSSTVPTAVKAAAGTAAAAAAIGAAVYVVKSRIA